MKLKPLEVHVQGRNAAIRPEWAAAIDGEIDRLQRHRHESLLDVRVELLATPHHNPGGFELHVVVTIPGQRLAAMRQGEQVPGD